MNGGHARVSMSEVAAVLERLGALRDTLPDAERAALERLLIAAGMAETCPIQYNPYLPGVHAQPHPHYRRLREENPVHYSAAANAWVVTRYRDVVALLHDPRLSSRGAYEVVMGAVPPAQQPEVARYTAFIAGALNQIDPPEHTRLRRAFAAALSPERVAGFRPRIAAIVAELLDRLAGRDRVDLVAELAAPLPPAITRALLDIPAAGHSWYDTNIEAIAGALAEQGATLAAMRRGDAAVTALSAYLAELARTRRGARGDDMVTALTRTAGLGDGEIASLCLLVALGSHENVRHAVALSVWTLLSIPGAWQHLTPAALPLAVQELLRWTAVSSLVGRTAAADISIGHQTIPAGSRVILLLAAANRDPERFGEPETLRLDRRPNPHIGFGAGIHVCPGAGVARLTLTLTLAALRERFPQLALEPREMHWREERNIRGLVDLPVRLAGE